MDTPLGKGLESLIPDRNLEETPASLSSEQNEPNISEQASVAVPAPVAEVTSISAPAVVPDPSIVSTARSYQDHFMPRRGESIFWIEIEKIEPNPFQPRREFGEDALRDLAGSIREHGILQPVLVTKKELETPSGLQVTYELIAGERRWRAAKLAGLSQIPAIIRRGVPDDRIKLELAIIENVQREELNAMERARAFKQLIDEFHLVQKEIAGRIGKSREAVANTLRLLALPMEIQQALHGGLITEGHARAVLMAGDDPTKQFAVYQAILDNRLNVREAENRARQVGGKTFTPRKRPSKIQDPEMRIWQNKLQEQLGTKVQLQRIGERGKIVMEFYSEEELRGLLRKLIQEQDGQHPIV
ncbi:MAG: ParB/RepB/Spo0J family partition protein [Candidatus Sungbacteria bacterium]|nr:ParB/RepB/Spo0J family partition protein [bacterium]MDZ4260699.1 ParB/RepB/Spo0J family partition protein [Candidatus Sungbacteria bacterium]